MKVFISHHRSDSVVAASIAHRLRVHWSIETYLDVIDDRLSKPVEQLADHLRTQMSKCTQLLAVVSLATGSSQWVPWEVGVATEKDFPLATYSQDTLPPEFLQKWPYLRNTADLDAYARISKSTNQTRLTKAMQFNESSVRASTTREFYRDLRSALHQ